VPALYNRQTQYQIDLKFSNRLACHQYLLQAALALIVILKSSFAFYPFASVMPLLAI